MKLNLISNAVCCLQNKASKNEQELEKQRLKKEEAVKKFNHWQEEWRQKVKARIMEDKKKKLEEVEALRSEAKEKKEAAELAFNAWKAKKEEERKKVPKKFLGGLIMLENFAIFVQIF